MEIKKMELPLEDGTGEIIDQLGKTKTELEKESNKILNKSYKDIEEINSGKSIKLKGIHEKLSLSEGLEDHDSDEYDDLIHYLYDGLVYGFKLWKSDWHITDDNLPIKDIQEAAIESVARLGDDGGSFLNEDYLEEDIPKNLAKAFKSANKVGDDYDHYGYGDINRGITRGGVNIDFKNSNYTEITPEEAIALKKEGNADKIRAIFDGQLVSFNKEGKQTYKATKNYRSDREKYIRPNGDRKDRSNQLTFNTIIDRAEKLYVADEKPIDKELVKQRSENPESPRYPSLPKRLSVGYDLNNLVYGNLPFDSKESKIAHNNMSKFSDLRGWHNVTPDKWYKMSADSNLKQYNDYLKQAELMQDENEKNYYLNKANEYKNRADRNLNKYQKGIYDNKDYKARLRYKSAEDAIYNAPNGPKEIVKALEDHFELESKWNQANAELENRKANGSAESQRYKEKMADLQSRLNSIKKEIAKYSVYLDGSSELDDKAVKEAEKKLSEITDRQKEVKDKLDTILRRK